MTNDNKPLATELLHDERARSKFWRTAFITVLSALVIASGVIFYLLSVR